MKQRFGQWKSPLTIVQVAESSVSMSELRIENDAYFWLEGRPREAGRSVVVSRRDGRTWEIVPAPFSARSRVHEYGGGSYCIAGPHLWFVNATDQNVYCVSAYGGKTVERLTQGDESERFADLLFDPHRERLLAVRESHFPDGTVLNDLVAISTGSGRVEVLNQGHDFYSSPMLSADGSRLAFVVWDHPQMPWDGTHLYVGEMDRLGQIGTAKVVAGGSSESVMQPEWTAGGLLLFLSDRRGFWNLNLFDPAHSERTTVEEPAEFGGPAWVFGLRSFAPSDDRFAVAARTSSGRSDLVVVDFHLRTVDSICSDFSSYGSVHSIEEGAAFIGSSPDSPDCIVLMESRAAPPRVIHRSASVPLGPDWISVGEPLEYEVQDGATAHAYFYEPSHPEYHSPDGTRPPLLVLGHGGPTSRHDESLNLAVQFYTTRGWAVLDVNYGGSTGYGREYRKRLEGNWGVVDVRDCEAGVRFLASAKRIDVNRVAIKGGSAGGYTALQALTTSSAFKAGASHYGIADLAILASDTHKFESNYLERLVAPEAYTARSPIHHVEALNCPVIFFQGAEDHVVPPSQARMMFNALAGRGVPTALFIFGGEGHGFRIAENRQIAIAAEILFLSRVFGLEPDGIDDSVFDSAQVANLPW